MPPEGRKSPEKNKFRPFFGVGKMRCIKLTLEDGQKVYINIEHIQMFYKFPQEKVSRIHLLGGNLVLVKEDPFKIDMEMSFEMAEKNDVDH